MKLGRLNHIGVATSPTSVIASEALQSSALLGQSGLLRRFAPRNDGVWVGLGAGLLRRFAPRNDDGGC